MNEFRGTTSITFKILRYTHYIYIVILMLESNQKKKKKIKSKKQPKTHHPRPYLSLYTETANPNIDLVSFRYTA